MRSSDRYGPPPPLPAVVTLPEDSNAVEVAFRWLRIGDRRARVSANNQLATRIGFGEIAEPDPRGLCRLVGWMNSLSARTDITDITDVTGSDARF